MTAILDKQPAPAVRAPRRRRRNRIGRLLSLTVLLAAAVLVVAPIV
jgi:multiple sugar transport system permease protein